MKIREDYGFYEVSERQISALGGARNPGPVEITAEGVRHNE